MFCPNCGQKVSDGAKFCDYCGFPMAAAQPTAPAAEPQQPVQAQPTAAYPQPTQAQPTAAYPQPTQTQPTYGYQQQPQPTYQQVPGYAQMPQQTQAKKGSPVVKVLLAVLAVALVAGLGFLIHEGMTKGWNNLFGGGGTPAQVDVTPSDDVDTPSDDVDDVDDSTDDVDTPADDTDTPADDSDDINQSILDTYGNPTAYAFMNLDGSDIVDAVADESWEFDEDSLIWISEDGNNGFYVCGPDGYEYTEGDIYGMEPNCGNDAAVITLLLDDYKYDSMSDVVDEIVGDVTVVNRVDESDRIFLILKTASGDEDFALVTHDTDSGLYRLDIANPASISTGYTEDFFGIYGTTLEDVWYDATGYSLSAA